MRVTEGTRADCKEAVSLMEGISAEGLLAGRGCGSNEIIAHAAPAGMKIAIPPKRNRKERRDYGREQCRLRHLAENAFLKLKRWRGIAARHAKAASSFLAAVQVRCIAIWLEILAQSCVNTI